VRAKRTKSEDDARWNRSPAIATCNASTCVQPSLAACAQHCTLIAARASRLNSMLPGSYCTARHFQGRGRGSLGAERYEDIPDYTNRSPSRYGFKRVKKAPWLMIAMLPIAMLEDQQTIQGPVCPGPLGP